MHVEHIRHNQPGDSHGENIMKKYAPVIVLFFLSPIIGELLSGSAPPVEFFNPFGLIFLPALYGSGAILAREITMGWGKRWPTILILGLAYGIIAEGLMIKSFFDPAWPDLGLLGVYGRWAGVNWVWVVFLTLFHAVFSIAIPILLVEMLFPSQRDERWLGKKGMIFFTALLSFVVLFGFFVLAPYRPPVIPYLMAVTLTVALYIIAKQMPVQWATSIQKPTWRPLLLGLLGLCGTFIFFMLGWALPSLGLSPVFTIAMMIIFAVALLLLVRRASGNGSWQDDGRLALVSGALTFFILLGPISENDATRLDNPAGMTLVAISALVALLWMRFRVGRRTKQTSPEG
jgi:hypothetical protein